MYLGQLNIEGYKIDFNTLLGEGTYGRVYQCASLNPYEQQEQLCVKIIQVLDPSIASREEKILQLLSEKAQFNPNIVKLKKVIYDDNQKLMSVVMEKCQSDLLEEWKIKKVYSNEETMDVLKQLLNGYKPLYENKIIHRDLKPQNILTSVFNNKTIYKLSDFGIGKIYQRNDAALSKIGTPVYSPPECNFLQSDFDDIFYHDYKTLDSKSPVDIYSLGIILYQLLFGTFPFKTDPVGIRNFILKLKDQPLKITDCQDKDPQLIQLIERMIVFLPSKRITFKELFQLFFQETLTQRKMLMKTVQKPLPSTFTQSQFNQTIPQQVQFPLQQSQFTQRLVSQVVSSQIQQPQQKRLITIIKDYSKTENQANPNLINNQSIQNYPQQFQQSQYKTQQFTQSIQQSQIDFYNQSTQEMITELKESLSFLQNVAELSNLPVAQELKNCLIKLNSNIPNKVVVQSALYPLRQNYVFKNGYDYSITFIRFLFIFTYFAYGKQISDDPCKLSDIQMKSYLTQWYTQQTQQR